MDQKQHLYKLYYFDIYGRAESIRMLLSHFNIEYQDVLVPPHYQSEQKQKQFDQMKHIFEFQFVPVLQIKEKTFLSESRAILRYIMHKHSKQPLPTDAFTIWEIQSLVDRFADEQNKFFDAVYWTKNFQKDYSDYLIGHLTTSLSAIQARLEKKENKQYLVGDSLTIADILWVHFVQSYLLNSDFFDMTKWKLVIDILGKFVLFSNFLKVRKEDFPRLKTRPKSSLL